MREVYALFVNGRLERIYEHKEDAAADLEDAVLEQARTGCFDHYLEVHYDNLGTFAPITNILQRGGFVSEATLLGNGNPLPDIEEALDLPNWSPGAIMVLNDYFHYADIVPIQYWPMRFSEIEQDG